VYPNSAISHDPIQIGDRFLKTLVPEIMASQAWQQQSAIVIAWDENDYCGYEGSCQSPHGLNGITLGGGRPPFLVLLSQGAHHMADATPYNHYSFLATLEKPWGLDCPREACNVGPTGVMTQFFQYARSLPEGSPRPPALARWRPWRSSRYGIARPRLVLSPWMSRPGATTLAVFGWNGAEGQACGSSWASAYCGGRSTWPQSNKRGRLHALMPPRRKCVARR